MKRAIPILFAAWLILAMPACFSGQSLKPAVTDDALLPFLSDSAQVQVLILLRDQPLNDIAQEVQANRLPQVRSLEERLRAIGMERRPNRTFLNTEEERVEAKRLRDALTPEDKTAARALAKQIISLLDLTRQEIGDRMRQAVSADQRKVSREIEFLGGTVIYAYNIENALAASIPGTAIEALAGIPEVAYIELSRGGIGLLDVSLPSIYASAFHNAGETGGDFRPAICDTGVDTSHPALSGHTWTSGVFHDTAKLKANYNDNSTSTDDLQGHGSHVAGIATSADATYRGVAYGATRALNLKAGYKNTNNPPGASMWWDDARKAVDWGINTSGFPPHAINFSFGDNTSLGLEDSSFARFWDAVVDGELTPVAIAAGNSGPNDKTINDPAGAYNIVCVANMDDKGTTSRADDAINGGSSRGPVGANNRKKPDITAPGTVIMSCNYNWEGAADDFVWMTGTSMAAPHITGVMTLLADVGVTDAKAQKAMMVNTAVDWGAADWDKAYGWGYVDLDHLYLHRADLFMDSVTPTTDANNCYDLYRITGMTNGEKATLVWNRHVTYNGSSEPGTWSDLNDLNLYLYTEGPGAQISSSTGTIDNVEQVKANAATNYVIKVVTPSAAFNGVTTESYALATEEGATKVTAPLLGLETPYLEYTPPLNAKFTVTAYVSNGGGLLVTGCSLSITVPAGVTLVSGAQTQYVTVPVGGYSANASWTLKVTIAGAKTVPIALSASAYGFTWNDSHNLTITPGAADAANPRTIALIDPPAYLQYGVEKITTNGGFESDFAGWTTSGAASISTTEYHGGAKSAYLGSISAGSAYRDVSLNLSATRITLQFWYKTWCWGTYGTQLVQIRNTANELLSNIVHEHGTHDWQLCTVDLTQYKGTTIRIYFYARGESFLSMPGYMWVDDVSVLETPTVYVRTSTPWRLTAIDDYGGVDYTQYQIDSGGWTNGTQFTLGARPEGTHTVDYRSVDNSGNTEVTHTLAVELDDTPPNTAAMLYGGFLGGSSDKIVNGGFESGSALIGWTRGGTTSASTAIYHTGAQSALVGGGAGSGSIYHDIFIDGANAVLSLWYRSTGSGFPSGTQTISVQDTSGNILEYIYWGVPFGDPGYFTQRVVDLTRFSGQTVRLKCEVGASTGGATSGLYVDDVCLFVNPTVYTSSSTSIEICAKDRRSGVKSTEHQVDSGGWLTTNYFTLPAGSHTLSYRSTDNVDIVEPTTALTIQVDSTVPDGTVLINYGATTTFSRNVTLTLTATSSVTKMHFKNEVGKWGSWVAFASTYAWTLTAGSGTKRVYAEFRDASGNVSPDRYDVITNTSLSVATIPEAKTLQDGTGVILSGKTVSAGFTSAGKLYVQEVDRSAGICVLSSQPQAPGDVIQVEGTVDTLNGERVFLPTNIIPYGPPSPPIPLLVRNADVGGADFEYQPGPPEAGQRGVLGAVALNNVGLLLTSSGTVTPGGPSWFYISDGSLLGGLKVDATYLTSMPFPGAFVFVTGICSVEPSGEDLIPVLVPRGSPDIVPYTP